MKSIMSALDQTTAEDASVAHKKTLSFAEHVQHSVETYFAHLEGDDPQELYDLVLAQMEIPLLRTVMQFTRGNQSRAAKLLGLSRGTLRKKLSLYDIE